MIDFAHSYSSLPPEFYQPVAPSSAIDPKLILFNYQLAKELGLPEMNEDFIIEIFSGKKLPANAKPLAMAYAGHQFGNFVPQLGDGRAVLIGDIKDELGHIWDLHLKGSGQTAFSRRGDGKSSLGPVIREYLLSEHFHALGIPTTRALAAFTSGDQVFQRQDGNTGAIFTRVSRGHIRVGTFEYFAARKMNEHIKTLADFCIKRLYPEIEGSVTPYLDFVETVSKRKLSLVAQWMKVGFIHGVMNTDNTSIAGETIDFGPCAFMDQFSFKKVFSSIDRYGRYAYNNQGNIALWNLGSFANCLIPLIDDDQQVAIGKMNERLSELPDYFEQQWLNAMASKFGILKPNKSDKKIIEQFLKHLEENSLDFTNSFRELPSKLEDPHETYQAIKSRLEEQEQSTQEAIQLMNRNNPVIIARNHQVEKAIRSANRGDFTVFKALQQILLKPFDKNVDDEYKRLPEPNEIVHQTFCGT